MVPRTVKLLCMLCLVAGAGGCQRGIDPGEGTATPAPDVTSPPRVSHDDDDDARRGGGRHDRDDDQRFPPPQPGERTREQRPDATLRRILREIDRHKLEATVRRLVQFGTRHTLSSQTDPVRGIGAATRWVTEQFEAAAARSGGRMTVTTQSFVQAPGPRIPVPTTITNVMATLRGTTQPDRIYVVSGHLDSRITDVLNPEGFQPGADDDASGVALVLELARVMAAHPMDATIVFTAVAGEEQGLFGSAFQATQFRAANADIQGMFSNDIVGSSTADDGTRDPNTIRLFTEGVPTSETPAQGNIRRSTGGEVDSV